MTSIEIILAILAVAISGAVALFKTFYMPKDTSDHETSDDDTHAVPTLPPVITPTEAPKPTKRELLYLCAKGCLGKDITPTDNIPDAVACVAQLQEVYRIAFGTYIGSGGALYSTYSLVNELEKNVAFEEVAVPLPGDIVVSATHTSPKPNAPRGHCGIVGKKDWMSNTSFSGLWEANYTKESWEHYFVHTWGFETRYFRLK